MADRSVGELVRAASAGDQDAWDRLVDRHSGLVWTVIRSHRLMPEDAADVFQSTWLHLVESLQALRDP
ncbi:MAG: RNA polymerase sigma factor, partial [Jiangellaceae bacterium]